MPTLYELRCDTEEAYVQVWGIDTPDECPNDAGHTISTVRRLHDHEDYGRDPLTPNNFTFDQNKIRKFQAVDTRTGELIAPGFAYSSKQFSLSQNAQSSLHGLNARKDTETYPIEWNTIDDLDVYSIDDATDAGAFYDAAATVWRTHKDSGTTLKSSIRAATTQAELDAVEDTR